MFGICPLLLWLAPLEALSDYCGTRPSVSLCVLWAHGASLTPDDLCFSEGSHLGLFTPSLGFGKDAQALAEGRDGTQAQIRFLPPVAWLRGRGLGGMADLLRCPGISLCQPALLSEPSGISRFELSYSSKGSISLLMLICETCVYSLLMKGEQVSRSFHLMEAC